MQVQEKEAEAGKLVAEDPNILARRRRGNMPAWARARVLVLQRLRRGRTNWAKVSWWQGQSTTKMKQRPH